MGGRGDPGFRQQGPRGAVHRAPRPGWRTGRRGGRIQCSGHDCYCYSSSPDTVFPAPRRALRGPGVKRPSSHCRFPVVSGSGTASSHFRSIWEVQKANCVWQERLLGVTSRVAGAAGSLQPGSHRGTMYPQARPPRRARRKRLESVALLGFKRVVSITTGSTASEARSSPSRLQELMNLWLDDDSTRPSSSTNVLQAGGVQGPVAASYSDRTPRTIGGTR